MPDLSPFVSPGIAAAQAACDAETRGFEERLVAATAEIDRLKAIPTGLPVLASGAKAE